MLWQQPCKGGSARGKAAVAWQLQLLTGTDLALMPLRL